MDQVGKLIGAKPRLVKTDNLTSAEHCSGADILFALDPKTARWAQAGFTADSNWWLWDILCFEPEEADPHVTPQVTNESLTLASHTVKAETKVGWGKLDTSKVTEMSGLFNFAPQFNCPIGTWNTSTVRNMKGMFSNARSFDQSLACWDISRVTSMHDMFWMSGISPKNLSATLIGWANTARNKGAKKRVVLSRLPHQIHDLTEEAQLAIHYMRTRYRWDIESKHYWEDLCPNDHLYCEGAELRAYNKAQISSGGKQQG